MLEPAFSWQRELELAKILTKKALDHLAQLRPSSMSLEPTKSLPREMKSAVDQISEDIILGQLLHTGFPVLSEEAGLVGGKKQEDFRWIIDLLEMERSTLFMALVLLQFRLHFGKTGIPSLE